MIFRGIKKRLFLQFWILFFLAMVLVDVLVLFIFIERNISQKINAKMHILIDICEAKCRSKAVGTAYTIQSAFPNSLDEHDQFLFVKVPSTGITAGNQRMRQDTLSHLVFQTFQQKRKMIKKHKLIFGWLFFQHEFVVITYPVKSDSQICAVGGIEFPLTEEYQAFNRIQKIALVFVFLFSFFFAFIGNQQLSRLYYQPLKRLAKLAETFRDEDSLFFAVRKEDNEFSVLSSSLNKMLNRITKDKKVLKDTIGSLRKANNELQKAQNDVIRAEKMATVGRLTSGIAHEIGNPIGIVLGYLDLLKQADLDESQRVDFIDRSEKEITRINGIIRQLLDMSRASTGEAKPVCMHQLLEDLVAVFSYQPTASHIKFYRTLSASNDEVFADPDQLRQVFLNILLNAVDEVNAHSGDDAWIKILTEQSTTITDGANQAEKSVVTVTIEDNGVGINPSHLPHIFDPFYTTKEPGKGTGLGLSVSFMIVERLGGSISVDQRRDAGAAFHVTLPAFIQNNNNPMSGGLG
jgi:signal transduction histidine kinase